MGGSNSKSEFSRKKSLVRRSSQRSLFVTARRHLTAVNRKIDKLQTTDPNDKEYIDLKHRLDEVQKELDSVSDILKDKHKEKYEDSRKYLFETFEKLEAKIRQNAQETEQPPQSQPAPNSTPIQPEQLEQRQVPVSPSAKSRVQLSLLKVLPTPENSEADIPLRSPKSSENQESPETESVEASNAGEVNDRSSKVSRFSKMGIQVLPPVIPQTRLTMLLENKRHQSEGSVGSSPPISPRIDLEKREKYRPAAPDVVKTPSVDSDSSSPTFFRKSETKTNPSSPIPKRISGGKSPVEAKAVSPLLVKKNPVQNGLTQGNANKNANLTRSECYKIIEDAREYTDHLERQLKLFKGSRDDPVYFYIQEGFFRNLMKLDTIDPKDDAVLRQEKKLGVKRIEELVNLLDMKVTATLNNEAPAESSDDDVFDEYEPADKKDSINSQTKPAVATHL